jgi:hypothetical protein
MRPKEVAMIEFPDDTKSECPEETKSKFERDKHIFYKVTARTYIIYHRCSPNELNGRLPK